MRRPFEECGFMDPIRVLAPVDCAALVRAAESGRLAPPLDWPKGYAPTSRLLWDVATLSSIVDPVRELIGDDVMLWGLSFTRLAPGERHHWHTDIETAAPDARAVSVWIGLTQTDRRSSLALVPGSHRLGRSLQQAAYEHGCRRADVREEDVAAWARELGLESEIARPALSDGEALLFDGRLWHGSHNRNPRGERIALLAQFAAPDVAIRMPGAIEWPFRPIESPRPPCVLVSGHAHPGVNRMSAPPPMESNLPTLTSQVRNLPLPLAGDPERGWKPHPQFAGRTPNHAELTCHASVLEPGRCPHAPHAHDEEEILVVLDGKADVVVVEDGAERVVPMEAGRFAYYPAGQRHTIRNASPRPITYLMFKWRGNGAPDRDGEGLRFGQMPDKPLDTSQRDFRAEGLFDVRTGWLARLSCHFSTLAPGGGYEPHVDAHDAAILVQQGTLETCGASVSAGGVIYNPAGEPHGLRNVGDAPATYLVFEFHSAGGPIRDPRSLGWRAARRLASPVVSRLRRTARDHPRLGRVLRRVRNAARSVDERLRR